MEAKTSRQLFQESGGFSEMTEEGVRVQNWAEVENEAIFHQDFKHQSTSGRKTRTNRLFLLRHSFDFENGQKVVCPAGSHTTLAVLLQLVGAGSANHLATEEREEESRKSRWGSRVLNSNQGLGVHARELCRSFPEAERSTLTNT